MNPTLVLMAGVIALTIGGCGRGASDSALRHSGRENMLSFRYAACKTTDNDWDVTAAALIRSGEDASYDSAAGRDAGVLADDLNEIAAEASAHHQASTALIYRGAATLFQGDAALLPSTGQVPADTGGYINAAGAQLKTNCSLGSFKPTDSIEGPYSTTATPARNQTSSATSSTDRVPTLPLLHGGCAQIYLKSTVELSIVQRTGTSCDTALQITRRYGIAQLGNLTSTSSASSRQLKVGTWTCNVGVGSDVWCTDARPGQEPYGQISSWFIAAIKQETPTTGIAVSPRAAASALATALYNRLTSMPASGNASGAASSASEEPILTTSCELQSGSVVVLLDSYVAKLSCVSLVTLFSRVYGAHTWATSMNTVPTDWTGCSRNIVAAGGGPGRSNVGVSYESSSTVGSSLCHVFLTSHDWTYAAG